MATITLKGNPIHTNGELPAVGTTAPAFSLTTVDLSDKGLSDFAGKKKLLNIVPSLDTPVCAVSTEKFNEAAKTNADLVVLVISADLPFAMGRFCGEKGIENVVNLSLMRGKNFAKDYGVFIEDGPMACIPITERPYKPSRACKAWNWWKWRMTGNPVRRPWPTMKPWRVKTSPV